MLAPLYEGPKVHPENQFHSVCGLDAWRTISRQTISTFVRLIM
jgi:hypothetical protein